MSIVLYFIGEGFPLLLLLFQGEEATFLLLYYGRDDLTFLFVIFFLLLKEDLLFCFRFDLLHYLSMNQTLSSLLDFDDIALNSANNLSSSLTTPHARVNVYCLIFHRRRLSLIIIIPRERSNTFTITLCS